MTPQKPLPSMADTNTHNLERSSDKKPDIYARRHFLLAGGAAAAGVAVTAATMMGEEASDTLDVVAPTAAREGYHLSAHIKKYYETTLT